MAAMLVCDLFSIGELRLRCCPVVVAEGTTRELVLCSNDEEEGALLESVLTMLFLFICKRRK